MNKIILVSVALLLVAVTWLGFKSSTVPRIAYIKSADLVYNYEGMKEAQQKQEKKTEELKSNLDTLQVNFQKAINQYNSDYSKLSKQERLERENLLSVQQNQLKKYTLTIEEMIKKQDEQLTSGVLNQVNSFVETYAKKKGYDLVLGTTTSGNVLFAKESMDITNEVLLELNNQFKNTPASSH